MVINISKGNLNLQFTSKLRNPKILELEFFFN